MDLSFSSSKFVVAILFNPSSYILNLSPRLSYSESQT